MQLLKPTQSTRPRPREALRLHRWMRACVGRLVLTKASALFIARCCCAMQRRSQRQFRPMFSRMESWRGALLSAPAALVAKANRSAASAALTGASNEFDWWEGQSVTLGSAAKTPDGFDIYAIDYEMTVRARCSPDLSKTAPRTPPLDALMLHKKNSGGTFRHRRFSSHRPDLKRL
jgi:hypothetical protein